MRGASCVPLPRNILNEEGLVRIGVDIRELVANKRTGIGSYLTGFLQYALRTHPGHTYILYGNQNVDFSLDHENVILRRLRESVTLWWDQVLLVQWLRKDRVDCFFSPYYKAPILGVCPHVITIHDLLFMMIPEYRELRHRLYNLIFRRWAGLIASRANRVLTDSECSRRDIIRELKVEEDKVRAVPLSVREGIGPVKDQLALNRVKEKYHLRDSYMLSVGNLKPHKNIPMLLEMYARLPKALQNKYQLVLAGGDAGGSLPLQQEIAEKGLKENIVMIGGIPEQDLPSLYSGAYLFLFPSLYEGFGLPALEAMTCGTPVVASRTSSIPEVVGEASVLLDPRNTEEWAIAVKEILEDDGKHKDLSSAGLLRAQEFTPERCYGTVFSIIEEAVNDK